MHASHGKTTIHETYWSPNSQNTEKTIQILEKRTKEAQPNEDILANLIHCFQAAGPEQFLQELEHITPLDRSAILPSEAQDALHDPDTYFCVKFSLNHGEHAIETLHKIGPRYMPDLVNFRTLYFLPEEIKIAREVLTDLIGEDHTDYKNRTIETNKGLLEELSAKSRKLPPRQDAMHRLAMIQQQISSESLIPALQHPKPIDPLRFDSTYLASIIENNKHTLYVNLSIPQHRTSLLRATQQIRELPNHQSFLISEIDAFLRIQETGRKTDSLTLKSLSTLPTVPDLFKSPPREITPHRPKSYNQTELTPDSRPPLAIQSRTRPTGSRPPLPRRSSSAKLSSTQPQTEQQQIKTMICLTRPRHHENDNSYNPIKWIAVPGNRWADFKEHLEDTETKLRAQWHTTNYDLKPVINELEPNLDEIDGTLVIMQDEDKSKVYYHSSCTDKGIASEESKIEHPEPMIPLACLSREDLQEAVAALKENRVERYESESLNQNGHTHSHRRSHHTETRDTYRDQFEPHNQIEIKTATDSDLAAVCNFLRAYLPDYRLDQGLIPTHTIRDIYPGELTIAYDRHNNIVALSNKIRRLHLHNRTDIGRKMLNELSPRPMNR